MDWDQPLQEGFLISLRSLANQLPSLAQLRLPRCYFRREMGGFKCKLQLHISSDTSEVGYGASSELRIWLVLNIVRWSRERQEMLHLSF